MKRIYSLFCAANWALMASISASSSSRSSSLMGATSSFSHGNLIHSVTVGAVCPFLTPMQ